LANPEEKRPFGKSMRRWKDSFAMDFRVRDGRGRGRGIDWINLAQDRGKWRALLNAVMNIRVP